MRILAVGAHPDDVEFGCAPVLLQEASQGHQVRILVCSRGEAASSGTAEGREQEARAAAQIIGAEIDFLELGGDCHIQYSPATSLMMAREIRTFQPEVVLAPLTEGNQHPDHAAVGKAVRDGARLARYGGLDQLRGLAPHAIGSLFYYAVTQIFSGTPQVLVDVSRVQEQWVAAMNCHQSQMASRPYVELVNARARAMGAAMGVGYAVGLWTQEALTTTSLSSFSRSARYF
jgi:N-acetylglucosamine malate deacetylase 1